MWFTTHSMHSFSISRCFSPGIRNDLDFLLLLLFRADASHGKVFKDIQISQELEELTGRDHQLLHLYINIQNDIAERAENEVGSGEPLGMTHYCREKEAEELKFCWSSCYSREGETAVAAEPSSSVRNEISNSGIRKRMKNMGQQNENHSYTEEQVSGWVKFKATCLLNLCCCCFRRKKKKTKISKQVDNMDARLEHDFRKLFLESDFNNEKPEKLTYIGFTGHMGNVELLYQDEIQVGMRDMIYWFVSKLGRKKFESGRMVISNDTALDITFGNLGYHLALARAFKIVYSVQFHPYYRDPKNVVKKETFYTNYTIFTCPDNIYSSNNVDLSEINKKIIADLKEDEEHRKKKVDMILVGPITNESHKVSFSILLNTLNRWFHKKALLLAIRPLRIGTKKCSYFKYEPPEKSFKRYTIEKLKITDKERKLFRLVDNELGFKIKCGEVSCVLELEAYWYIGGVVDEEISVLNESFQTDSKLSGNGDVSLDVETQIISISSDVSVEKESD